MSYIATLVGEGNTSRISNMANPVDVTQNPASPFFVHPDENPGLILVTQPLNSKNYFLWSRSIKGSLIAKNKFCFVDGSLPLSVIPEQNQPAWHRCNQLVLSWIKHALSPSIAQSIIWFDTAAQVWQNLKNRFSQGNALHIAELQDEILATVQGDLAVTDYFTNLHIVWEELINFRAVPSCECTPQSAQNCVAIKAVRANQEQDFIIKFLRGLNVNFAMVKSQILMLDPLPPVDRVFNLVLQHERQLERAVAASNLGVHIDSTIQYAKAQIGFQDKKGSGTQRKGQGLICSYCVKEGHVVDQCFKKHGYPPNSRQNKKRMAANLVADSDSDITGGTSSHAFTPDQYNKLLVMLQAMDTNSAGPSGHSLNSVVANSNAVATPLQPEFDKPSTSTGASAASISTAPIVFGSSANASSASVFNFSSPATATPSQPVFVSTSSFGSSLGNNDQMNMEDSMAEDTVQATTSTAPAFGQHLVTPASFVFGSAIPAGGNQFVPAGASGVNPFQFGSQPNLSAPQNQSLFQASGSLEFNAGGSFSLGTGGGDKSNRKFVRVNRKNQRRK